MHTPDDAPQPRIVSLLPAATEIVVALGLERHLVGRSHECDFPPSATALPALTATRIDPHGSSREIHEQVGRTLGQSTETSAAPPGAGCSTAAKSGAQSGLFTLDIDRLAALAPDVILTQAACDVCAVATADVAEAVQRSGTPCQVVSLAPASLDNVLQDILTVGAATDRLPRAREVVARLRARIASVTHRTGTFADRPRVAVLDWLDPPMAAGHWVPEMIRRAGGAAVLGRPGSPSHWVTWQDVAAADPDVVVLAPCGFALDRVVAEAGSPAVRPPHLEPLRAAREGRVYAVDGHHLFNRPGPRLVDSLEVLAEILHPGRFRFAANNTPGGYLRLSGFTLVT
jgi:iron complex transport system substrate-binding protein